MTGTCTTVGTPSVLRSVISNDCSAPVASHPTAWRVFTRLDPVELRVIDAAIARARTAARAANSQDNVDEFVIDMEATLVTT